MDTFKGKTIVITGASRGIGLAIALRFAAAGANIVVISKDAEANLDLAKAQIVKAGGQALVLNTDVTDHGALQQAVDQAILQFGSIDVLVNNTSATCFTNTLETSPAHFDLVVATSVRAAFFMSQLCLPYLKDASNPHIINISPPLNIEARCFKDHLAFSLSKYAMSLCTLGMAEEFKNTGIAVNSLWPETTIATQTIEDHFSAAVYAGSRWPSIMGDAAYLLVLKTARECSGQFFTDEALLRESGVKDFSHYAVDLSAPLMQSLFVPLDNQRATVSQDLFLLNR